MNFEEDIFVHTFEKKLSNKKTFNQVFYGLLIVLGVLLLINIYLASAGYSAVKLKAAEVKEANRPAEISLMIIDSGCKDCFDVEALVTQVKDKNVKILDEKRVEKNSEEAKTLIEDYNIKKLPTVIVSGELDKFSMTGFETVNDKQVFMNILAPYVESSTGQTKGLVKLVHVTDTSCVECISMEPVIASLGEAGVKISDIKKVDYTSPEGKKYISDYGLKETPALLISNEVTYYNGMKETLVSLGSTEVKGFFKLHSTLPPYRKTGTGQVAGLVDMALLKDSSCQSCYDVEVNKQIMERFGLFIKDTKTYDVNSAEGKQLISKYKITKVPILILSPDAKEYPTLSRAWPQVGTTESDGWFIMRKPEVIGSYKDLSTNQEINPNENIGE